MRTKGKAVRLTDKAHALLAVKSDEYSITQKEIASEAIILLTKRESIDKQLRAARADVIRLEEKIRDNRHAAFGAFVLGAIAAGCLGVVIGVMI